MNRVAVRIAGHWEIVCAGTHAYSQENRLRPHHAGNTASDVDRQRSARILRVSRIGRHGQRHGLRLATAI